MLAILMMAAAAAAGDSRSEIDRKLETKISLHLRQARLNDALDLFRSATGLNFVAAEGGETAVSLVVNEVSARSALRLLLAPTELVATVGEGAVVIRSRQCLANQTVLRVYDVRAALVRIQDFPCPEVGVVQRVLCCLCIPIEPEGGGLSSELLITLIKANAGDRSWFQNERCSITERNGLLYVTQTPRVHREIDALLSRLQF